MTDPMEQEREDLWQKIEELTGMRFINRKQMPEAHEEYSVETKELIRQLKDLDQKTHNRADVRRLSRMLRELNSDGEMSAETYLWWVNRY